MDTYNKNTDYAMGDYALIISRHTTDYWIKNNSIDVSIKDINGHVDIHWHEFYEIELILHGKGSYHIDGIDYDIKNGSLFIMSPSSFHSIDFTENTTLINFMFTVNSCDFDLLSSLFASDPHMMLTLCEEEINLFHTIAKEMVCQNPIHYHTALLNSILGKIQILCKKAPLPLSEEQMQRAILYIQNHFREEISLSEISKIANYSSNYFSNKFKKYTGITFKKYINDMRFSLVEKMLAHTTFSVTEICHQCGFKDFSNFMFYFKHRYHKTPSEFRNQLK